MSLSSSPTSTRMLLSEVAGVRGSIGSWVTIETDVGTGTGADTGAGGGDGVGTGGGGGEGSGTRAGPTTTAAVAGGETIAGAIRSTISGGATLATGGFGATPLDRVSRSRVWISAA